MLRDLSTSKKLFLLCSAFVIAVAVAPLFLIRSVRRMNLPDTLRVME